jgi:hypothetical protein
MSIDKLQLEMGLGETQDADAIVCGTVRDLFTGPNSPSALLESGSLPKLESFTSTFALRA